MHGHGHSHTEKPDWLARHEVLSVSVASNISGHCEPKCFVTNGDPAVIVGKLMEELEAMSNDMCGILEEGFKDVFDQLLKLSEEWECMTIRFTHYFMNCIKPVGWRQTYPHQTA